MRQKRKYLSVGVRKSSSFDNIVTATAQHRRNRYSGSGTSRLEHRKTIFIGDTSINDDDDTEEDLNLSDDEDCAGHLRETDVDDIDSRNDQSFVRFAEAQDLQEILRLFSQVKSELELQENISSFREIFNPLFLSLSPLLPHRYSELLKMIRNKSLSKEYRNNLAASGKHVLIIGNNDHS